MNTLIVSTQETQLRVYTNCIYSYFPSLFRTTADYRGIKYIERHSKRWHIYARICVHIQIQFHPDGISRSRRCSFFRGAREAATYINLNGTPDRLPQGERGFSFSLD